MMTYAKRICPLLLLVMLLVAVCCPTHAAAADYSCTVALEVTIHYNGNEETPFTVNLAAKDNAPLPQKTALTRTGSGTVTFDGITFTAPGDYQYTLTQTQGSAQYVTYDTTVYDVTIRVTNDGNTLRAEIWAVRDGATAKVSQFTFENRYDPPEESTGTQTPANTPQPQTTGTTADQTAASTQTPMAFHLPQTGDGFPLLVLVVVCVMAALGLAYGIYHKRKNKGQ